MPKVLKYFLLLLPILAIGVFLFLLLTGKGGCTYVFGRWVRIPFLQKYSCGTYLEKGEEGQQLDN